MPGTGGHRADVLERLQALGYGVFVLDYRGYGGSEGSPSEDGLYSDAEAARAWLLERGRARLVYHAESLGTGVAVELARRHPPEGLVLEAAFDSAAAVAKTVYPFLPVDLLMKDRFDSDAKIGELQCPLLMLHGTRDQVVPFELGERLFALAPQPKRFVRLEGAGHNDPRWVTGKVYWAAGEAFLAEVSSD